LGDRALALGRGRGRAARPRGGRAGGGLPGRIGLARVGPHRLRQSQGLRAAAADDRSAREGVKRMARVLLAALVFWTACGPGYASELRIGLAADVTSMDPHFLNLQPNVNISWHVFDALTHVDADARLIPGLAVSWRALDATTWEFKLRRGVRFHDGSEFTADDVVFSIERTRKVP